MEMGVAVGLLLLVAGLFYVLPAVLVIGSGRVRGNDLVLWVAAVLFTSWLGFVAFLVVTTLAAPQQRAARDAIDARRARIPTLDISDHRPG